MDNMYSKISVFLFIIVTVFCTPDKKTDICITLMANTTCLRVTSCPYALKLIDNRDLEKIAKLSCGFEGTHPKVCCPKGEVPILYNITEEVATNRPKPTSTLKPSTTYKPSTTLKPSSTLKPKETSTPSPPLIQHTDEVFPSKAICGKNGGVVDRIIGGTIARLDEHPWLARIAYKIDYGLVFGCSAALITDRYLLTAAHCVVNNIPVGVRLGEWNAKTLIDCDGTICNNNTIDVEISEIITHPTANISRGADGDIALIKLKENVTFTDFILPICLPITKYVAMQDYYRDNVYSAAGWGQTEFESESVVKRKVQLKAAPIEVCRNIFNLKAESERNIICAGGSKGKDTCAGDSGGPLVKLVSENYEYNWYLFGITSFGSRGCGSEGVPGMYTRVTVYMDWIRDIVST